jgi:hypothetical protein
MEDEDEDVVLPSQVINASQRTTQASYTANLGYTPAQNKAVERFNLRWLAQKARASLFTKDEVNRSRHLTDEAAEMRNRLSSLNRRLSESPRPSTRIQQPIQRLNGAGHPIISQTQWQSQTSMVSAQFTQRATQQTQGTTQSQLTDLDLSQGAREVIDLASIEDSLPSAPPVMPTTGEVEKRAFGDEISGNGRKRAAPVSSIAARKQKRRGTRK